MRRVATYVLLVDCFLLAGCAALGIGIDQDPRYPAVIFDVARCYDNPPVPKDQCKDYSKDVYLSFDYLAKSDSVLWQDIVKHNLDNGKTNYWRLNIWRVSSGDLVASTYQNDTQTDWLPKTTRTFRKELPFEILLRAEFDFCAAESPEQCDIPSEKISGRNIKFLVHIYPEETK
jgi:hypothetical protein